MKVVDIANEIYVEAGSPTSTSIPSIAFWLRSNFGKLNNLIFTSYELNDSYEFVDENDDEITAEAASILKKLYVLHKYDLDIRSNLNSLTTDTILEVSDQGSSVKKINKNEVSKTLASLRRQESEELDNLVASYKNLKSEPRQVVGDDTVVGDYGSDPVTSIGRSSDNA